MKPYLLLAVLLSVSLFGCQASLPQTQTQPLHMVGQVELGFDQHANKSSLTRGVITDETQIVFTPSIFSVITSGSDKFLTATFDVTNNTGAALQDLTLVAYAKTGDQASTAIKGLQNFAGLSSTALDNYARAVKPMNAMLNPTTVNNAKADLQVFTEAETAGLQTDASSLLQSGEYLFPYGFVARSNSTSRSLATGANTGTITLSVKVPDSNEPSSSVERFRMTFLAYTQPVVSRVSQSLEEQGTTDASTRQTDLGAMDMFALGGSSLLSNASVKRGCAVRTAGTLASPLDFLVNTFNLTGFAPAPNLNNVVQTANVDLTSDQIMNLPSSTNLVVRGEFTGDKTGTFSGGGSSSLSFNPITDFLPGELVTAETVGECVPGAHVWQYRAKTLTRGALDNAYGTFQAKVDYTTGSFPESVVLGDVNGDRKLDMITANNSTNSSSVLLGNGDGTFQAKNDYTSGPSPSSVVLGDVNGDAKLDIITANAPGSFSSVVLGNGDGTFQFNASYLTGYGTFSVALGDVNGDAKLDIITANTYGDSSSVLLGNGNGTFQNKIDYPTGLGPVSVVLGDVNGDTKLDIITANQNGDSSSVLLGNGDGTFQTKIDYITGSTPESVVLGDVNGDAKLDIITVNVFVNSSSVLLNK
jgi:hypothetical protein